MDKATLIGLIAGIGVVVAGHVFEGGHVGSLLQPGAFFIVVGGTFGAMLTQSSLTDFKAGIRLAKWTFAPPVLDYQATIAQMVGWSQTARRGSFLDLEKEGDRLTDPFLKKGLRLLVNGSEPDLIADYLLNELTAWEDKYHKDARFWEAAAGYSPTLGILGAVLGLIHTMANISDPDAVGAGIAVAFVATIYGIGLANLVYLPIYKKLTVLIRDYVRLRTIQIEGLLGIAGEANPRQVEGRMQSFLLHEAAAGTPR